MRQDIAAKLSHELDQDIVSERQVVYILVEARKLLEQNNALKNFRAFKLCADWAVHPKLKGPDAQTILKYFDEFEADHQRSGSTVTEFSLQSLNDFMSHKAFRQDFMDALFQHQVNISRLAAEEYWQSFVQHYTSVIQDCPLEAVGNNTQLVSHVSALAWLEEMAYSTYPGKRVIRWNWTLRGSGEKKLVCALV
jgi:hypothetical protein